MALQKFSNGDRVSWMEGDVERRGVVTESDIEGPPDAAEKAATRFYRVTAADGTSYAVSEADLEPTDKRNDPSE